MGRFRLYEDCTYKKFITITGIYYEISVPYKVWEGSDSSKVAKHIEYWIRRKRLNKHVELKYGNVKIIDDLPDESILRCLKCDKTYTCRSGIIKHIRNVHIPSISEGELVSTDLTNPRTTIDSSVINNNVTNNVTNNNINNTINITLRPFGEENPKWLTAELLFEALQNLNGAIPRLLQEKHFNDSFPENQNIQISDIRHINKRLRVYEKTGWRIRNREQVLRSAMDKAYDLLYDAVHNDADDTDEEDTDETKLSRKEIRRLHNSRRARRTIERALQVFDEFRPYTTPTAEDINDEVDTMLLDKRERTTTETAPAILADAETE